MALALAVSSSSFASTNDTDQIAFFDVETSMPPKVLMLEFGAVVLCPRRLVDVSSYSTLVRPADLDVVPATTSRCNGITRDAIADAPPFRDVADNVYGVLHGRVWAGHNTVEFDSKIIREAFAEIGRAPPQPKGMIDTLHLLTQRFGRRAGDMKMQSLANYFGLGRQRHRSLDDVRMNIDVVKYCATVLLLEESPRGLITVENQLEGATTMSQALGAPSEFVEPGDVSTECINITVTPMRQFGPRTIIQHKGAQLQLRCTDLKVRFGVRVEFLGTAGQPKLNFVVDIPKNLMEVLQFCDDLAQSYSQEAGSDSEWRPLIRRYGNANCPTVRLNIPTVVRGGIAIYSTSTHIYQKDCNGVDTELVSREVDEAGLNFLLRGNKVDAFFSLEVYDFQQKQKAGIRLVANRIVVHFKSTGAHSFYI